MGHVYAASAERYSKMVYNPCGKSGLKLPLVSLGLWHNFGNTDCYVTARRMVETAFDAGITHFDLANNYGPEPGSAEITFGQIMKESMAPYRDEMIISTKAGYGMWPGPYGDHGSRKYLIASCDQSLKRNPETPIEESMLALDHIVRSGRALYVGISNYGPEATAEAVKVLRANKTPFVIQQMRFNMLDRTHERNGLFNYLADEGIGGIVFSPLAQGLLTNRYLNGIPADSRASKERFLKSASITPELLMRIRGLDAIASKRGQTLAQMAIAWILQIRGITSALIGASRPEQILDVVAGLDKREFSAEELAAIDAILK